MQEDKKNLHFAHGRFIDKFVEKCYNDGIKKSSGKELSPVIKKCLLLLCALAVQATGLASCEGIPQGVFVSEVGTVSDQPGVSVAVPDDTCREYLSTEGDGEILYLYEDGSFLTCTVTELSAQGETGNVPFFMKERVTGTYVLVGEDVCLTIGAVTFSVTGLEEHPALAERQSATIAGEDSALYTACIKLFGGKEVDGRELLGEERFAELLQTEVTARLHESSSTFTYDRDKNG